jgi:hypothetical protein
LAAPSPLDQLAGLGDWRSGIPNFARTSFKD